MRVLFDREEVSKHASNTEDRKYVPSLVENYQFTKSVVRKLDRNSPRTAGKVKTGLQASSPVRNL